MKPLFKKPKWLKPEINELKYWLHVVILAFLILGIMAFFKAFVLTSVAAGLLTVKNVLILTLLIALSDVIAHTVLQLD